MQLICIEVCTKSVHKYIKNNVFCSGTKVSSRHVGFSSRIDRLQCVYMAVYCIEMTKDEAL